MLLLSVSNFAPSAQSQPPEVKVLSAIGMRQVMLDLGPECERATGYVLAITFDSTGRIAQRIAAGENVEVVLINRSAIDPERCLLSVLVMAKTEQLGSYAGRKLARRLTRSIPYLGALIALATLGTAIRRKGWVGGALHTGLDAIPYVGGAKNLAEVARGRDFLPDKVTAR